MAGFRISDGPADLRAVPHPAVTLAIDFGDGRFDIRDPTGRVHSGSLALGLADSAAPIRVDTIACVQIRLSPPMADAVVGHPPAELAGKIIGLDDLWGRDATELRDRLHAATTWDQRFALVDQALTTRIRTDHQVDPEVVWIWRRITATRGVLRVESLAAEVGWSRQRLWSRFGTQLGHTPKRAAMLVRFDNAVHRLIQGHPPARVAAESGYADQPHLHREIRAFTGVPLSAAIEEPWLAVDDRAWPADRSRPR